MSVVTLFAPIWANPEPTVLFLFHCFQKEFANLYINLLKKLFVCAERFSVLRT
jgi:hypothetical protein